MIMSGVDHAIMVASQASTVIGWDVWVGWWVDGGWTIGRDEDNDVALCLARVYCCACV